MLSVLEYLIVMDKPTCSDGGVFIVNARDCVVASEFQSYIVVVRIRVFTKAGDNTQQPANLFCLYLSREL